MYAVVRALRFFSNLELDIDPNKYNMLNSVILSILW